MSFFRHSGLGSGGGIYPVSVKVSSLARPFWWGPFVFDCASYSESPGDPHPRDLRETGTEDH